MENINWYNNTINWLGKRTILRVVLIGIAFLALFMLNHEVCAKTITVANDGFGNYEKIQDGIDNASAGDTVFVYNGIYYENVIVNSTINLNGESKENTIIDGNGKGDVVRLKANWVNISRFLITNCGNENSPSKDAGINISLYNNNQITNCIISNNSKYGFYLWESSNNQIKNCIVANNTYQGIFTGGYSDNNQIKNCTFSNNIGGGLYIFYSNNKIDKCKITNNSYYGIILCSSNNQITNCTISNNLYNGIELFGPFSKNNQIANCLITNNSDNGIYLYSSSYNTIINCTISNNSNSGIYLDESISNQIINCIILFNFGDGIILNEISQKNHISYCIILKNLGNGIYFSYSSKNEIVNCSIRNNSDNGIFSEMSHDFQVTHCIISNNSGTGIILEKYSSSGRITNCTISYNSDFGIYLANYSKYNFFQHNSLIKNKHQAYDEGSNYWNDSYGGNYWSDYKGKDKNRDGIGDTPYNIPASESQDRSPLIIPFGNRKTIDQTTIPTPDFGVMNITLSNPAPKDGEQITINVTVYHHGDVEWIDNVTVKFYYYDKSNTLFFIDEKNISLELGEEKVVTIIWFATIEAYGINVTVDEYGETGDTLILNNEYDKAIFVIEEEEEKLPNVILIPIIIIFIIIIILIVAVVIIKGKKKRKNIAIMIMKNTTLKKVGIILLFIGIIGIIITLTLPIYSYHNGKTKTFNYWDFKSDDPYFLTPANDYYSQSADLSIYGYLIIILAGIFLLIIDYKKNSIILSTWQSNPPSTKRFNLIISQPS